MKNLRKVQQLSRTDVDLLWNFLARGSRDIQVMPSWDDAQLKRAEVESLLSKLSDIAEARVKSESWTMPVSKVVWGEGVDTSSQYEI